jgi:endonuclease-3 related protein
MDLHKVLMDIYEALRKEFGHQGWWPGETPLEVMVGAILTQRTNWTNAEKALEALKEQGALDGRTLAQMDPRRLQELVRPSGYYRQKAARLGRLARWLVQAADGRPEQLADVPTDQLRQELLGIRGIGPETADSILLYALERPTFVVDTYTKREVVRHGLLGADCGYLELKELFEYHLPREVPLYQDYHAQLVRLGKEYCRPRPLCAKCPLHPLLGDPLEDDYL